jgi:hypothetical protein
MEIYLNQLVSKFGATATILTLAFANYTNGANMYRGQ